MASLLSKLKTQGGVRSVIRVLHLSDCHLFADVNRSGYGGVNPYWSFEKILKRAFANQINHFGVEAIIITGDISGDNSAQSYQHFFALLMRYSPVPFFVIPGNHDDNPYFQEYLGNITLTPGKSVTLGHWQIHGLDTRGKGASGKVCSQQLTTITDDLNQHASAFHLLCLHHHIRPSKSWMDKHALVNSTDFLCWLENQRLIRGILHGHVHYPIFDELGEEYKVPVFGAPSTCWQWAMTADFGVSELPPGGQIITLHDTGAVTRHIERL